MEQVNSENAEDLQLLAKKLDHSIEAFVKEVIAISDNPTSLNRFREEILKLHDSSKDLKR